MRLARGRERDPDHRPGPRPHELLAARVVYTPPDHDSDADRALPLDPAADGAAAGVDTRR